MTKLSRSPPVVLTESRPKVINTVESNLPLNSRGCNKYTFCLKAFSDHFLPFPPHTIEPANALLPPKNYQKPNGEWQTITRAELEQMFGPIADAQNSNTYT